MARFVFLLLAACVAVCHGLSVFAEESAASAGPEVESSTVKLAALQKLVDDCKVQSTDLTRSVKEKDSVLSSLRKEFEEVRKEKDALLAATRKEFEDARKDKSTCNAKLSNLGTPGRYYQNLRSLGRYRH